jgi:hypothetical protein
LGTKYKRTTAISNESNSEVFVEASEIKQIESIFHLSTRKLAVASIRAA